MRRPVQEGAVDLDLEIAPPGRRDRREGGVGRKGHLVEPEVAPEHEQGVAGHGCVGDHGALRPQRGRVQDAREHRRIAVHHRLGNAAQPGPVEDLVHPLAPQVVQDQQPPQAVKVGRPAHALGHLRQGRGRREHEQPVGGAGAHGVARGVQPFAERARERVGCIFVGDQESQRGHGRSGLCVYRTFCSHSRSRRRRCFTTASRSSARSRASGPEPHLTS